jgi:activating signal cointegrator complex subunit 1
MCSQERGISEDVFQLPEKFHLTIGVLRIFSEEEEEKAKAVVKEAIAMAKAVLGSDPAVMCVGGVDTMKDDPTAVDVLFAKVVLTENPDRLQAFVDAVQSHVIAGAPDLMRREFDREGVKLHATLMNSCFPVTLGKTAEGRGNWRKTEKERREPFDARKILREFRDFEFGQMSLQILHLSKRKEYGPDGFYRCVQNYALSQIEPNACS